MLDTDKIKRICNHTTKDDIKIMLLIHGNGVVSEDDIIKVTGFNTKTLSKCLQSLRNKGLITVRTDDMKKRYLVADISFYDVHARCEKCVNMEEESLTENGKTLHYKNCNSKRCAYNFDFRNIQKIRGVSRVTQRYDDVLSFEKRGKGYISELADFILDKYSKFDYKPQKIHVASMVRDCLAILKNMPVTSGNPVGSLKQYVVYVFTKAKLEKKGVYLKEFSDIAKLSKYFNKDNKTGKRKNVELCKTHKVYCSYMQSGICKLKQSGVKCDAKIKEQMGTKYGRL